MRIHRTMSEFPVLSSRHYLQIEPTHMLTCARLANQKIRAHSQSSLQGQIPTQDHLSEEHERQYRLELRLYMERVTRAGSHDRHRYRKLERAGVEICYLMANAEDVMQDPETRSAGSRSTTSFPGPRHAPPTHQPRHRPSEQRPTYSTRHTQVSATQSTSNTSSYHAPRQSSTQSITRGSAMIQRNEDRGPRKHTDQDLSERSYTYAPMSSNMPSNAERLSRQTVDRDFLGRDQRYPTSRDIPTERTQHRPLAPHLNSFDNSVIPSPDDDTAYEEARHYRRVDPSRIVDLRRPPPPDHRSRSDRTSYDKTTYRVGSVNQNPIPVAGNPAQSRTQDVHQINMDLRSYHSQDHYASTGSTPRRHQVEIRGRTSLRTSDAARPQTNSGIEHPQDSQQWRPESLEAVPSNIPTFDNRQPSHSSQSRGSNTILSGSDSGVMPESPRYHGAQVDDNAPPLRRHAPRKPSSSSGDSGYVPESPRPRPSTPDAINRKYPPITINTQGASRRRTRRSSSRSSSRSIDSGFVDGIGYERRSSSESDQRRRSSGGSQRSRDSQSSFTSSAETYTREKRSRRGRGSLDP